MKLQSLLHEGGALVLIVCGWCIGDGIWQRAQAHLEALQKTLALLERLHAEIAFRRADLGQLLRSLQQEGLVAPGEGSLQRLTPFPQLSPQEQALFCACFSGLGRAETQQECRRLELYTAQFQACREELQPRLRTTQELAHKLGLALGLAAAVLLL